jgi:hypothetical protein
MDSLVFFRIFPFRLKIRKHAHVFFDASCGEMPQGWAHCDKATLMISGKTIV